MTDIKNPQKCYNSLSCVLSVFIIIFVVCAIGWDIMISKPAMKKSIDEIRIEVKGIHEKIDDRFQNDSLHFSRYLESMKIYEDSKNKK